MTNFEHTVLIVDDDWLNITALTHLLSDEFNVFTERSGSKSVKVAKDIQPDVILLDVVMPDMNGFEVITALKKDEATKDIPVIFVTGLNNTRDEEQGLILGAVDYINKPFSSYIVKLRIRNQLQISSQIRTIHELSTTDSVTGLGVRGPFHAALDIEWRRTSRIAAPLCFAIFSIDNFKEYIEKHDQLKGDHVLRYLARIISEGVQRAGDKIVRWGVDEFAVLLTATTLDGVLNVAENIRKVVEKDAKKKDNAFLIGISISAGVHSVIPVPKGSYTVDDFISDTSSALMCAKRIGGNKISSFNEIKGGV